MTWLPLSQALADAPIDGSNVSIAGYLFGWGPLGVSLVALGWLMYRGWRLVSPSRETTIRESARADLLTQIERLITEKRQAEEQRDKYLQITQEQIAPLLSSFVSTTSALVPILQEIIRLPPSQRWRGGNS